jgi:hypothetical protein
METNSLALDIYFLLLERKLTVDSNLMRLEPNCHGFELSP